jgi:hypothetical protein
MLIPQNKPTDGYFEGGYREKFICSRHLENWYWYKNALRTPKPKLLPLASFILEFHLLAVYLEVIDQFVYPPMDCGIITANSYRTLNCWESQRSKRLQTFLFNFIRIPFGGFYTHP